MAAARRYACRPNSASRERKWKCIDLESGAVVLTPVRPSAKELLELRDGLLQEPGFREEIDGFFEGLHDTRPPEPVDFP